MSEMTARHIVAIAALGYALANIIDMVLQSMKARKIQCRTDRK